MESLHRLPMLYFDMKQSHSEPDFSGYLKKFIHDYYQENPESFNLEIKELEELRKNALNAPHDTDGCARLKRYYAQLISLLNRFRFNQTMADIKFVWSDNLTKQKVTGNFQLELDCVLHNIGALHSELGALGKRETSDNKKLACTHFQCAAWVYEMIRENPHCLSKDLSREIVSFNHQIMMAQAQECVLEKSILDSRKPLIVARVSAQVVDFYGNIIALLVQSSLSQQGDSLYEIVGSKLFKEWKVFIEFKIAYYSAATAFFMGNSDENPIGQRIAWYTSANDKLKSALKLAKNTERLDLVDAVNHLMEQLEKNLAATTRENDFIYHETVPGVEELTAVTGVTLVKSTQFNVSDPEVSGKDIFHRLVPIEAYETVSIYTDKKDKLWREIKQKIESKNEELINFMSVLQLDKEKIRQRIFHVPERLVTICASLSVNCNIVDQTQVKVKELEKLSTQVDERLAEADVIVKKLDQLLNDKKPTDRLAFEELRKELNKHSEVHKRGSSSNKSLKESLDLCTEDVRLLARSSVQDLEELFTTSVKDLPNDEKNLNELERLFDKVEEMRKQRDELEKSLQDGIKCDDILKKVLVTADSKLETLFETELKKHDQLIGYLNQNMNAQENVLDALTKANADYTETRKAFKQLEQQRQERIESLISAYESFERVVTNVGKGCEFYEKLNSMLKKLIEKLNTLYEQKEIESKRRPVPQPPTPKLPPTSNTGSNISGPKSINAPSAPKLRDYLQPNNRTLTNPSTFPSSVPVIQPQFASQPSSWNAGEIQPPLQPAISNNLSYQAVGTGSQPSTGYTATNANQHPAYYQQMNMPPNNPINYYNTANVSTATVPIGPHPSQINTNNYPVANPAVSAYPGYPGYSSTPAGNWAPPQMTGYPSTTGYTNISTPVPSSVQPYPPVQPFNAYGAYAIGNQPATNPTIGAAHPLEYQMQNLHVANATNPVPSPMVYGTNNYITSQPVTTVSATTQNIMNSDNDLSVDRQPVLQPVCLHPTTSENVPKDPPPSLL